MEKWKLVSCNLVNLAGNDDFCFRASFGRWKFVTQETGNGNTAFNAILNCIKRVVGYPSMVLKNHRIEDLSTDDDDIFRVVVTIRVKDAEYQGESVGYNVAEANARACLDACNNFLSALNGQSPQNG